MLFQQHLTSNRGYRVFTSNRMGALVLLLIFVWPHCSTEFNCNRHGNELMMESMENTILQKIRLNL